MFLKSKVFKHGNISAQSVRGSAHKLISVDLEKPMISTYEVTRKNLDETFKLPQTNEQRKVEPFDTTTGIISNSPEIIAFSNFIPAYDRYGELNEYGNYLEKKQDAHLINTVTRISKFDTDSSNNEEVKLTVLNYCEEHAKGIDELLSHFSNVRKKLDFRFPLDISILKQIGSLPPDSDLNSDSPETYSNFLPLSLEEILNDSFQNISKWSPSKVWLQSCLELKEVLANGMIQSFLADGNVLSTDPTNESYYDPYSLVTPKTSFIKKFGFSEKQTTVYPLSDLLKGDSESYESVRLTLIEAFRPTSIFNQRIFSDSSNIDESIAKVSHLLCKEYVYSTKMKTDVLTDYGYPFNFNGGNVNIWNHLVGLVGSDITDISPAPLGGGKSLVSLSQTVEPDATEVLTFEDRYVYDNVGTVRPNVIITPGTFYYLESSINTVTNGFDLTRLNRYLTRLNSANNMLKMVRDELLFKEEPPISTVQAKVTNTSENNFSNKNIQSKLFSAKNYSLTKNSKSIKQQMVLDCLSNPISFVRHIEEKVLNGSGLLRRQPGPKLWTNKNYNDVEKDVSALLISLAIEKDDAELQSLLFLHQIYTNYTNKAKALSYAGIRRIINPADSLIKSKIVDQIIDRIKRLVSNDTINPRLKNNEDNNNMLLSISTIKDALLSPDDSQSLSMLNKIGDLLFEFDENFESNDSKSRTNGKFFLDQTRNTTVLGQSRGIYRPLDIPIDKKSAYSGVQKTLYVASIFKLCLLMVHAANPERLTHVRKPNNLYDATDKLSVTKVKNAVVGVFLTADQIKQGLNTISLLEKNITGQQTIDIGNKVSDAIQKAIDVDPETNFYKGPLTKISLKNSKIRSLQKKKIDIFELPNSIQKGSKIFDGKNLSKKINITTGSDFNFGLVALEYDDTIVKVENMLASYDSKMSRFVDRFYGFVYTLRNEFLQLKNNLQLKSGQYGRTLTLISRQIGNPTLTRALFSEEQLLLVRSKMQDYIERLRSDYSSPLRESVPYFLNYQKIRFDDLLPVEDIHSISWNMLLKDFLNRVELSEGFGSNKKIMSIGIPQKLHRRMRINSSGLSGLTKRNSIIQVCIYRVNAFLPDVVYKPLTFTFDLKLFPTRVLSNYKKCGFDVSGNGPITVDSNLSDPDMIQNNLSTNSTSSPYQFSKTSDVLGFIPHYKSKNEYDFQLITPENKPTVKDNDYQFLDESQFSELLKNHSTSLLLEEYLRFVTDLPFDEQRYINYQELKQRAQTTATRFVAEYSRLPSDKPITSMFFDELIATMDPFKEIATIIMPRKFDRVFNILIDPDDFVVDEASTPDEVIAKYLVGDTTIKDLSTNFLNEPTFDKYYVLIKSFEGSNAA